MKYLEKILLLNALPVLFQSRFSFYASRANTCANFWNKGARFRVNFGSIWTLGSISIQRSAGAEKGWKTKRFSMVFMKTYEKPMVLDGVCDLEAWVVSKRGLSCAWEWSELWLSLTIYIDYWILNWLLNTYHCIWIVDYWLFMILLIIYYSLLIINCWCLIIDD